MKIEWRTSHKNKYKIKEVMCGGNNKQDLKNRLTDIQIRMPNLTKLVTWIFHVDFMDLLYLQINHYSCQNRKSSFLQLQCKTGGFLIGIFLNLFLEKQTTTVLFFSLHLVWKIIIPQKQGLCFTVQDRLTRVLLQWISECLQYGQPYISDVNEEIATPDRNHSKCTMLT